MFGLAKFWLVEDGILYKIQVGKGFGSIGSAKIVWKLTGDQVSAGNWSTSILELAGTSTLRRPG